MNQISDEGRAGDKANKIRQRPCQGHAVQSHCSGETHLSRLEAGYSDCELHNFLDPARTDFCQKFYSPAGRPDWAGPGRAGLPGRPARAEL